VFGFPVENLKSLRDSGEEGAALRSKFSDCKSLRKLLEKVTVISFGVNAKARAGFTPLELGAEHSRTCEAGDEIRNRYTEDRSQNVVALLVIGLLTEAAVLAFLIHSVLF
jgi:hypothetical protein